MKLMKSLISLTVLGLATFAGCGGTDTVQESEPQPEAPRPAESAPVQATPQDAGTQAGEYFICRNLQPGDRWYPTWAYCCDTDDRTRSHWTGSKGSTSETWSGSCYSWGIR